MSYVGLGTVKAASAETLKNVKILTDVASFARATKVLSMYGSGLDFMASIVLAANTGQEIDWSKFGSNYLRDAGSVLGVTGLVLGIVAPFTGPAAAVLAPVAAASGGIGILIKATVGGDVPTNAQVIAATAPLKKISSKNAKDASTALSDPIVRSAAAAVGGGIKTPPGTPTSFAAKSVSAISKSNLPGQRLFNKFSSKSRLPLLIFGGGVIVVGFGIALSFSGRRRR